MTDTIQKAHAWDLVGGMFWRLGRVTARPSAQAVDQFLFGAGAACRVCVVGASTKNVVEAALARQASVTVIDFSGVMCRDLRHELPSPALTCHCADILGPPAAPLVGAFDVVVADRLINRMVHAECAVLFAHVCDLLRPGGVARLSAKLGFYEMDRRLLDEGRRRGTIDRFFDQRTRTIDFSQAESELSSIRVEHGRIPSDVLLPWYVGRGRESRFELQDLHGAIGTARARRPDLALESVQDLPDADGSVLLTLRRR